MLNALQDLAKRGLLRGDEGKVFAIGRMAESALDTSVALLRDKGAANDEADSYRAEQVSALEQWIERQLGMTVEQLEAERVLG